ncbi:MAG: HEAT repeat domain-containing protein, partial [Planctomycetaceae bacterium]|nr:HEAT repeat domain-containing protein [Planctomycetaceae bacterium]
YNPIIQHGEVDFRDPRRDHTHGRIWRVSYKGPSKAGTRTVASQDLTKESTATLLKNLTSEDGYVRQQSKQVLKERGDEILPELTTWASNVANDHELLEALWVAQSIRSIQPEWLNKALASDDHRVRAAATRLLGHWLDGVNEPLSTLERLVNDDHPRVRLESVRVLSLIPNHHAATVAMQALDHDVDQWGDYALWQTARDLQPLWEAALNRDELQLRDQVNHLVFLTNATRSSVGVPRLVTLLQQGEVPSEDLSKVLSVVSELGNAAHLRLAFEMALDEKYNVSLRSQILNSLANAARARKALPEGQLARIDSVLKASQPGLWEAAANCVGAWKLADLRESLQQAVASPDRSAGQQALALRMIGEFSDEPAAKLLASVAKESDQSLLQRTAVEELLRLRPQLGANLSVDYLQGLKNAQESSPLFESLLRRKGAASLLAKALEGKQIPKDVAILGTRVVNSSGQQAPDLLEQLRQAGGLGAQTVKLSAEEMSALTKEIQEQGNSAAGQAIFRRQDLACMRCHSIGPAGGLVGSNLVSLGATAPPDYIVESLLDPNAKVKEGYHTVIVATDEGQVFSGIKLRETDTALILRDAEDREISVPLDSIDQQKEGSSLMPAGLTNTLTRDELVNLSAFLSALGRLPDYTVGTSPIIRHWNVMQPTDDAAFQLRRTSYATAATDPGRFQWTRAYSLVNGNLPLEEIPGVRVRNRVAAGDRGVAFVSFSFTTEKTGDVQFQLNSAAGLQIWLDGLPLDATEILTANVEPGEHLMTFAVDPLERSVPLRVQVLADNQLPVTLPTGK